ncbi:MAG: M56 family metallopeptidase [Cyclonatronaceae bacterium]
MQIFIEFISSMEAREIYADFWVSILIWSAFAGLLLLVLRYVKQLPPLLNYHLSSAALLALPLGLLLSPLLSPGVFWPSGSAFGSHFTAFLGTDAIPLPEIMVSSGQESADNTSFWPSLPLSALAVSVLLVMPFAGLFRLARLYARMRKDVAATLPLGTHTNEAGLIRKELEHLCDDFNIGRSVEIRCSATAATPFTMGWRRPLIVLPAACLNTDKEHLRPVLAHELIHIARADYALHFIELFIRHLFWLHPLVHLLYRNAAFQRELACDAEVLRRPDIAPAAYARLLYDFAFQSTKKPVFQAAMSQEPGLLRRIRQIEQTSSPLNATLTNPQTNQYMTQPVVFRLPAGDES